MNIVRAQKIHIPRLLELLLQVELVHHAIRPDIFRCGAMKYDAAALEAMLSEEDKPIFVAVEEEAVLGYCFCQRRDIENSVFNPRRELYIDDLCVDEAHRGKGIAGKLYRHAVNYARAQGCGYVTLNVWQGNEAENFYKHMGLRPRNIMMEQPLEEC